MTEWRKSSRCLNESDCVEVSHDRLGVKVRDSAAPTGPFVTLPRETFARLLGAIKEGR